MALLLQTSCNTSQFSGPGESSNASSNTGLSSAPPPDTALVQEACAATTGHRAQNVNYFFLKPLNTCEWGKDGNLEIRNGFFQGRIEQEQPLMLESGAIICDIKFSFQKQQFLYDDHFIVSFNDAIIASSYNFQDRLTRSYDLLRYDWSKIAGMKWNVSMEGTLCAAGGQCSWPKTDLDGTISMDYPSILFQRLMAEDIDRNSHSIKFISIGDNDDKDCEHSDVNFSLKVDYVVPK